MQHPEIYKHLRHNLVVNLMDGAFFGFALGFASFVTILPLFVSTMTDSAVLIGLIPAIHSVGWQLPQLMTAESVARQRRYKPMVLFMTIHERLPFLGLAFVALAIPYIGVQWALALTFILLIWQGLGGGFTATAWQSMIGKIIPSDRRGTFYGAQSAAANLLASLSAIAAGFILARFESPQDYSLLFFFAALSMAISWVFLAKTREPEHASSVEPETRASLLSSLGTILKKDPNFRWFLVARMLSQFAVMGIAFYTVFAVRHHGVSEVGVGVMTSVFLGTQIALNPIMGWIGDRWSHRGVMEIGILAAILSSLIAWWAPDAAWFYLAFILAGAANVAIWTIGLAIVLEFGTEQERPTYIGMANTLIAPATILAPVIGGWLADLAGYPATFIASAAGGMATLLVFQFLFRDPRHLLKQSPDPTHRY